MPLSPDHSDEELVDAFIQGDNKAFSAIVEGPDPHLVDT